MFEKKWLNLQLFAGEGAGDGGGDGATTGESAVDPGQQRLLELGVPKEKLRKNRAYQAPAKAENAKTNAQQPQAEANQQPPTATENPAEEPKTEPKARMSWDEIMADPEYNKQMQAVVQSRLRSAKGAEDTLGKLTPALELLARKHGQDPANIDYDALAQSISDDESFYEDKALQMGVSVETAKKIDQQERDTARQQREQERTLEQQKFQQHIIKLEQQGEALKRVFPNFDLRTELQNPAFARMTSPNVGISVEDAYYAVHRNEIQAASMQVTAQKTAEKISNAIRSGSNRPAENGTTGQAPSVTTFDYRSMSPEQRKSLKDRIRSGEKIYPGQV